MTDVPIDRYERSTPFAGQTLETGEACGTRRQANSDSDTSLIEFDAGTGAFVDSAFTPQGSQVALAYDGSHVWVASASFVSEVNADDATYVRPAVGEPFGSDFGLHQPSALAVAGGRVWVANARADSLTELPAG